MPYRIKHHGSEYEVMNALTGKVHAKGTTKKKAMGQLAILNGIHSGFVPMHSYQSKVIPRGGKKNSMEK